MSFVFISPFTFLNIYLLNLVWMMFFCLHACVAPYVPVAHRGHKRELEPPELELKVTMGVLVTEQILLTTQPPPQPSV